MRARLAAVAAWATLAACGDSNVVVMPPARPIASAAPSASASAEPAYAYPPDDPVPQLRTGSVTPVDYPDVVSARVNARHVGDVETLLIEVPLTDEQAAAFEMNEDRRAVVVVARGNAAEAPYAFAVRGADYDPPNPSALFVWARRALSIAGTPVSGDVYTALGRDTWGAWGPGGSARNARAPAMHIRFKADDAKVASDPKAQGDYFASLAATMEDGASNDWHRGPFYAFVASRAKSFVPAKKTKAAAAATPVPFVPQPPNKGDLARLMETTTGATALQEALQHERGLFLANARAKQTTSIATLKAPSLSSHPWKTMIARLKQPLPQEALAAAAPAEFWFARATDFAALLRTIDQAATWGTPLASVMGSISEDRGVLARYEAELGVKRGPLTEKLGPSAVAEIAIVGSDPYFVEGTDVTLVFRPKSRDLLNAALGGALAAHEAAHGAITTTKRTHDVDVTVSRSADGAVHQERATVGDFEIVSNSPAAIDRVIDAARGKRARLSDELDFQYMLGRDAGARADVLVFASDRFVSTVIGPQQKIQEARRQIALAELQTPGFAALLYGHLYGKSPASTADLTRAKLLDASELTHAGGGAIAWKPGGAARSRWGTIAALTPLVDLPAIDKITDAEKAAYTRFADTYQSAWKHYVDPFAIRVASDPSRLTVDVRELPLIDNSDYKGLIEFVGDTRIAAGQPQAGMRAAFAIGQDSPLRQELDRDTRSLFHKRDLSLDWIADWATIGVLDRASLATTTASMLDDELPQTPRKEPRKTRRYDEILGIAKLPAYAAIGVRNPVAAALAMGAVRAFAEETVPGMIEWTEVGKHRGVGIVRIGFNGREAGFFGEMLDGFELFYAIAGAALVLSPNEIVLRKVIDERLDGKGIKGLGEKPEGSQLTFDVGGDAGGAVMTTMAWLLEMATLDDGTRGGRASAAALMNGAPERAKDASQLAALAIAYFGAVPSPPDGGAYTWSPDGVKDPHRGTLHAPIFPALPIDGSPVARIVKALRQVRTELGFDEEPGSTQARQLKSMHAKAVFELR